jgi:hypothetical protein
MPRRHPQYILDWVKIILDLRNKGILDPSYLEIAQVYFGAKIVPTPKAQPIKKNLRILLDILRYTHGFKLTHCLGKGWYYPSRQRGQSFRQLPPQNQEECLWCSPTGKRTGRWGIRFAHGKDDLMWQYMNNFHLVTSGSSFRHGTERFALGMGANLVGKQKAKKIIKASVKLLVPGNFKAFGDLGFNGDPPPFDNRPRKK